MTMRLTRQARAVPATGARVLVLFAHPAFQRSRVHRRLAHVARETPGVTLHDLYEAYPDHDIDVAHEQSLLAVHDAVVFEHPFYWYSTPSLLKEWQDLVLEFGWAYGPGGTALRGKTFLCSISTGGPEAAYRAEGHNRFTVRQLLAPIEQTARLCGMLFLPPLVLHGTHRATQQGIEAHATLYGRVLGALARGNRPAEAALGHARLDEDLAWLEPP
jgi:glutathione-regulated potassium-efflux system ancillary protein KefG